MIQFNLNLLFVPVFVTNKLKCSGIKYAANFGPEKPWAGELLSFTEISLESCTSIEPLSRFCVSCFMPHFIVLLELQKVTVNFQAMKLSGRDANLLVYSERIRQY